MKMLLGIILVLSHFAVVVANHERFKLKRDLLDPSRYDAGVRPSFNITGAVKVYIDIALNQIIDLDERLQILTASVYVRLYWTDERLVWNASDYGGIKVTRMPAPSVWRPDITLYSDVRQDHLDLMRYSVIVESTGSLTWLYPFVVRSACPISVGQFPFDTQSCKLKYGSWAYDGFQIDLYNKRETGDSSAFQSNGEFKLIDFPAVRHVIYYKCCDEPYPDVTFTIYIDRMSLYYMFNLVLPCIFIVSITVLGFYLPPESGEKVSLGVTVLLTLTVFLLLVAESTPPQSEVIPLISQYFLLAIVLVSISTGLTVMVVNLHHRGNRGDKVPYWVRKIVLEWLSVLVCKRKLIYRNVDMTRRTDKVSNTTRKSTSRLQNNIHRHTSPKSNHGYAYTNNGLSLAGETPTVTVTTETIGNGVTMGNGVANGDVLSVRNLSINGLEPSSEIADTLNKILHCLEDIKEATHEHSKSKNVNSEWRLVALVVDRILLWLFIVITIVVTLLLLVLKT